MKATHQFRRIIIVLFVGASLLLLAGPWPFEAVRGDSAPGHITSCDQRTQRQRPTQKQSASSSRMECIDGILAGQLDCILHGDLVLKKALVVGGRMSLDCLGHRLIPAAPGTATTRSIPEVGILAQDMTGLRISNCSIEGFDFGIYAINSKNSGGGFVTELASAAQMSKTKTNRRTSRRPSANTSFSFAGPTFELNRIAARYAAITLTRVDNTLVQNNAISFPSNGGRGIVVQIDSDRNTIRNNTLTADGTKTAPNPLRAPGPPSPSNALLVPGAGVPPGGAIVVQQLGGNDPGLLTATVDGQVFQFPATASVVPNGDFTEDNVIDGNTIVFPDPFPLANDGIALAVPQRTIVSNNKITRATFGVRVGSQFSVATDSNTFRTFPGVCNPGPRLCVGDGDCPGGTCSGTQPKAVQWTSTGTSVEGNEITGPFVGGILVAGRDTTVQQNIINGPLAQVSGTVPPLNARAGIALFGKHALETTVITRNTVSGAATVMSLTKTFQALSPACMLATTCAGSTTCLGLRVSLNDFTGYNTAVLIDAANDLFFDLSFNGQGNYWGLACPGFDPQSAKKDMMGTIMPTAQVVDCHSYSQPVANAIGGLPAPCR